MEEVPCTIFIDFCSGHVHSAFDNIALPMLRACHVRHTLVFRKVSCLELVGSTSAWQQTSQI